MTVTEIIKLTPPPPDNNHNKDDGHGIGCTLIIMGQIVANMITMIERFEKYKYYDDQDQDHELDQ